MEDNMKKKILSRRDFLRVAAVSPLAGAAMARGLTFPALNQDKGRSKVILIRNKGVLSGLNKPDAGIVQTMLDDAVMKLFGKNDPVAAWKTIVKPSDIVGIKTNVWSYIPTTPEVEQAIKKRVMDAGVPEKNIAISDRGVRQDPVFQKATVLINARPARTHHWSGVGSLIKNHIMFTPQPSVWHGDSCADLGRIWHDFDLAKKTKLNILVMLNPQFHGVGPHSYNRKYVWEYKGFIVGRDVVAVDATGLRIIEAKRLEYFGEFKPLSTSAKHVELADTRHHLGNFDPKKIELLKIGWSENILI